MRSEDMGEEWKAHHPHGTSGDPCQACGKPWPCIDAIPPVDEIDRIVAELMAAGRGVFPPDGPGPVVEDAAAAIQNLFGCLAAWFTIAARDTP